MTFFKKILLSGVWTLFVLTPFAISMTILRPEIRAGIMAFFLIYFLRRWVKGRLTKILKYVLLSGVLFSALTSLFYRLLVFIKFDCFNLGCETDQYLSVLAIITSIGTILFLSLFLWRERQASGNLGEMIPYLNDSAGLTLILMTVLANITQ